MMIDAAGYLLIMKNLYKYAIIQLLIIHFILRINARTIC